VISIKGTAKDYLSQLNSHQLRKFYQLSPRHRAAFRLLLRVRMESKHDPFLVRRELGPHLRHLRKQKIDSLLTRGVFELVADRETREIVTDYFFISSHDHKSEKLNRQNFNGPWPPDIDEMILHNLSYRYYIFNSTPVDDLCLNLTRLDRTTEAGLELRACCDVFRCLSDVREAKERYKHQDLVEIFALSYYLEWTVDYELDDEVPITDTREYISPRHISKDLETAEHNLLETQESIVVPKLFYGLFIKKSHVFENDLLPKYINIDPQNLEVPELLKNEPLVSKISKNKRVFVPREFLRIVIDKLGKARIGLYSEKEDKFYRLFYENYSGENYEYAVQVSPFKNGTSYIPFSNHLKIPIHENEFLESTLNKIKTIPTDNTIDRSRLILLKVKSLPYFVGHDLTILKMFIQLINDYSEDQSRELLCQMLSGIETYFDLPAAKRMESHSLRKNFSEFIQSLV
jgi:hypothetical protein